MDKRRCPDCGALNREDAEWCVQCLTRFDAETARAPEKIDVTPAPPLDASVGLPDPLVEVDAAPVATSLPGGTGDFVPSPEVVGTSRGAFSVKEHGITWTCALCGEENPLAANSCRACGTKFADSLRPREIPPENKDPNTAAAISLVIPGGGHAYLGQWAQAWARGIITLWVVMIVAVAAFQGSDNGGMAIVIMFGLIGLGLWLVHAHDAYREASGDKGQVLLRGRTYTYVVLGIFGLLLVWMMIAALQAQT